MIREAVGKSLDHDPDFRWRGESVTRIENLSDIAFAIALGMLISGADAPKTFQELEPFLLSIFPTAAGFIVLFSLWHGHYTFFRRYGVADKKIIIFNALLIFVVLFMAYPLRFAFDSLFSFLITVFTGNYTRSIQLGILSFDISGKIIGYFGLAYSAAFALFGLMTGQVLKKADLIALTEYELAVTRQLRFGRWGQSLIALATAAIAWFTPLNGIAGSFFSLFFIAYIIAERLYPATRLQNDA